MLTMEDLPASFAAMAGDGKVYTILRGAIHRQMRELEGVAAKLLDAPDVGVFGFLHPPDSDGRRPAAIAKKVKGQPAVFINEYEADCPLIRLGLLEHELAHFRRGDLEVRFNAPPTSHAEAEAACDAAGEAIVRKAVSLMNRSQSATAIDADACAACFAGRMAPCSQGAHVLRVVKQVSPWD